MAAIVFAVTQGKRVRAWCSHVATTAVARVERAIEHGLIVLADVGLDDKRLPGSVKVQ